MTKTMMARIILEIMRKKHYSEGFDMILQEDIKGEVLELFSQAIEQIQKEGLAYKPRHGMIKLTDYKGVI